MATPTRLHRIHARLTYRASLSGHPIPQGLAWKMIKEWQITRHRPSFRAIRRALAVPMAVVNPRRENEGYPRVEYRLPIHARFPGERGVPGMLSWTWAYGSWKKSDVDDLKRNFHEQVAWIRGDGRITIYRKIDGAWKQRTIKAPHVVYYLPRP